MYDLKLLEHCGEKEGTRILFNIKKKVKFSYKTVIHYFLCEQGGGGGMKKKKKEKKKKKKKKEKNKNVGGPQLEGAHGKCN